ncbi:MAG: gamma carbonic anhydrase family protein [Methylophilaceae bacterium]|uniref:gamma carbonic anhydrase family protein n=1 Tax=Methylovorus sp. MM2 TaxID=1848038 RepID=UPI0007E1725A|nr:gamma carbonic anhydrase family protein [Methylovorus sp. MM2]OAM52165.1 gamma carbonic anhydrase family protein [Methylovorus sp. MM2]
MSNAKNPNIESYQGIAPDIAEGVFIHHSATVIGDVSLGEDVSIWPGTIVRGDVNHIRIGKGSNVQDLSMLHVSHKSSWAPDGSPLMIGQNVTIGHRVILHGCTIEDECLIGMGSIVMDNVIVQKHVLVGAGSLVPEGKVLESGYLYLGSPAKKVRALTDAEIAHFIYSANHYMRLKNQYLLQAT